MRYNKQKGDTMKQATSFRLSDEVTTGLARLAERYKCSQTQVLEILILDRFNISDPKRNAARMQASLERTLEVYPPAPSEYEEDIRKRLYRAGYRNGWLHFQTRHGTERLFERIE